MKLYKSYLFTAFLLSIQLSFSQVGIGNTNPQSTLDITASDTANPTNNDGILIPRVSNFPSTNPTASQDGMLIFYTGTGASGKGFYYWDQTMTNWVYISSGTKNTLDQAYDQGGAGAGKNITASDGAVRIGGEDGLLVTGSLHAGNTIDTEITGAGTRLFFNPRKAAFRAGGVTSNQWDDVNIGNYSFATGGNTEASAAYSTALGYTTTASGSSSTALGNNTTASGTNSSALGNQTIASGNGSTAMGINSTASGVYTTALGYTTTASGFASTAMGNETEASGDNSTAMGYQTEASGDNSTAMGYNTEASGSRSTALGTRTIASGSISTAMGYETEASEIYSTAIGFQTEASSTSSTAMGSRTEASGTGSTAMGSRTEASGTGSTAMGYQTEASGDNSTAMGGGTTASGSTSTTMGSSTTASGNASTAMGSGTTASGYYTTAMGRNTEALSYAETSIGYYNNSPTPNSTTLADNADQLFSIGNGTASNRSNALTIYKSGLMNINDAYDMPLTDGSPNQVMVTDGAGHVNFVDASSIFSSDADWYEEGTTTVPNDITDNIFTQGRVGIGDTSPDATLDVNYSGTDLQAAQIDYTTTSNATGTTSATIPVAFKVNSIVDNANEQLLSGLFSVTGTTTNGASLIGGLGILNSISTTNDAFGLTINVNAESDTSYGIDNSVSSTPSTVNYGIRHVVNGASNSNYGGSFQVTGTSNTNYGIYSYAIGATTNWAGYFGGSGPGSGNVYIQDALEVNGNLNYTDGNEAAGFILGSNGSGDANWIDPTTIFTDTDDQTLSLAGTTLSIADGNSVDLTSIAESTTANNGLTETGDNIQLGGPLIQDTTIDYGTYDIRFNLDDSGDFIIQDNGTGIFTVNDVGNTIVGNNMTWRQNSITGTQIAQLLEDDNDGRFIIRENGNINIDLRANTGYVFNEQGDDRDFRVESSGNTNMLLVNAANNEIGIGGDPDAELHVYHGSNAGSDGFKIENTGTNNRDWRMYVYNGSGDLGLFNALNGNTVVGNFNDATGVYSATSDRRLKKDFKPLHFSWQSFMNLETLSYLYKVQRDDKRSIGLIAQDVDNIYPELVSYDKESDVYHLNYSGFGVIAIKAIQELKEEVDSLKAENTLLKAKLKNLDQLEARLTALEAKSNITIDPAEAKY